MKAALRAAWLLGGKVAFRAGGRSWELRADEEIWVLDSDRFGDDLRLAPQGWVKGLMYELAKRKRKGRRVRKLTIDRWWRGNGSYPEWFVDAMLEVAHAQAIEEA